jgi:hypothetical protein
MIVCIQSYKTFRMSIGEASGAQQSKPRSSSRASCQIDSDTIATTIHLTSARLPDSMITQSGTGAYLSPALTVDRRVPVTLTTVTTGPALQDRDYVCRTRLSDQGARKLANAGNNTGHRTPTTPATDIPASCTPAVCSTVSQAAANAAEISRATDT